MHPDINSHNSSPIFFIFFCLCSLNSFVLGKSWWLNMSSSVFLQHLFYNLHSTFSLTISLSWSRQCLGASCRTRSFPAFSQRASFHSRSGLAIFNRSDCTQNARTLIMSLQAPVVFYSALFNSRLCFTPIHFVIARATGANCDATSWSGEPIWEIEGNSQIFTSFYYCYCYYYYYCYCYCCYSVVIITHNFMKCNTSRIHRSQISHPLQEISRGHSLSKDQLHSFIRSHTLFTSWPSFSFLFFLTAPPSGPWIFPNKRARSCCSWRRRLM